MQQKARARLSAVLFFHSFAGCDVSILERYAAAAKQAAVSNTTVRNWVAMCKTLHREDWVVALAPKHQGRVIEAPISEEAYAWIAGEYFQLTRPALKPIYRRALQLAASNSWAIPSYESVKRRVMAEPQYVHVLKRQGPEAFARLYPPQERDYSTLRLHELWCGDGRKADLFVRWEDGSMGRPIVVAWQEVRSRTCVGYAIGKVESADLIRSAFKSAAERAKALPEAILVDNGRAFASKMLTGGVPNRYRYSVEEDELPGIIPMLGISVSWTIPYSGRSKPIESWWRALAECEKQFPGAYCGNAPHTKPEDFDQSKAIPIVAYRAAVERAVNQYHERAHRGNSMGGRSPQSVYLELLSSTAVRRPTKWQLRICMMSAEFVKLNPLDRSFRINGNRYWSPKLAELSPNIELVGRFDPEDSSQPVALYRGDQFVCEAQLIERTGFRDQQAAKDHARASRQFNKALRAQTEATKDMSKAASWITAPETNSSGPEGDMPAPKVVTPIRPEPDYEQRAESSDMSKDEFMRLVLENAPKRKTG